MGILTRCEYKMGIDEMGINQNIIPYIMYIDVELNLFNFLALFGFFFFFFLNPSFKIAMSRQVGVGHITCKRDNSHFLRYVHPRFTFG